jgi:hypothetical protein
MAKVSSSVAQAIALKQSELHKQKAALIAEKDKLAILANELRSLKARK